MFEHSRIDSRGFLRIDGRPYPKFLIEDNLVTVTDIHRGDVHIWTGLKGTIFVDIDGTIADLTHRRVHVESAPKNWPAFEAGIPHDTPIMPIIEVVRTLYAADWIIILATGRAAVHRDVTVAWLEKHDVPFHDLLMRPEFEYEPGTRKPLTKRGKPKRDFRHDHIVKAEFLNGSARPDIVFDDRNQVVDMWRSKGLPVVQVAPGDF